MRLSVLHTLQHTDRSALCALIAASDAVSKDKNAASLPHSSPSSSASSSSMIELLGDLVMREPSTASAHHRSLLDARAWALRLLYGFGATAVVSPSRLRSLADSPAVVRAAHDSPAAQTRWLAALTRYLNAAAVMAPAKEQKDAAAAQWTRALSLSAGRGAVRHGGIAALRALTRALTQCDDSMRSDRVVHDVHTENGSKRPTEAEVVVVVVRHNWCTAMTRLCAALEQMVWLSMAHEEGSPAATLPRLDTLLYAALECFSACWQCDACVSPRCRHHNRLNVVAHESSHIAAHYHKNNSDAVKGENDLTMMWTSVQGRLCSALLSLARAVVAVSEKEGSAGSRGSGGDTGAAVMYGDDDTSEEEGPHVEHRVATTTTTDMTKRKTRLTACLIAFLRRHADAPESLRPVNDALVVLMSWLCRDAATAALSMSVEHVFALMLRLLVTHLRVTHNDNGNYDDGSSRCTLSRSTASLAPLSTEALTLLNHITTFFAHDGHRCPARISATMVTVLLQAAVRQSRGVVVRASVHARRGSGGGPYLMAFCRLLSCAEVVVLHSSRTAVGSSGAHVDDASAVPVAASESSGPTGRAVCAYAQEGGGGGLLWGMDALGGGGQAMDDLTALGSVLAGLNGSHVRHVVGGGSVDTDEDKADKDVRRNRRVCKEANRVETARDGQADGRAEAALRGMSEEGGVRYGRQAWHVMWCALLQFWHSVVVVSTTGTAGRPCFAGSSSSSADVVVPARCSGRRAESHLSQRDSVTPSSLRRDDGGRKSRDPHDPSSSRHGTAVGVSMASSTQLVTRLTRLLTQLPRVAEALAGWQEGSGSSQADVTTHGATETAAPTRSRALFVWDVEEMMWCTRLAALLAVCHGGRPSLAQSWLTPIQHGFTRLSHLPRLLAVCWPSEAGGCGGADEVRAVSWFSAHLTRAQLTFLLAQPHAWTRPSCVVASAAVACASPAAPTATGECASSWSASPVVLSIGTKLPPTPPTAARMSVTERVGAQRGPHALTFDTLRRFIVLELQQLRRSWHDGDYSSVSGAGTAHYMSGSFAGAASMGYNNSGGTQPSSNNHSFAGNSHPSLSPSTTLHSTAPTRGSSMHPSQSGVLHYGSHSGTMGYGNSGWHGRGSSNDTAVVSRESSVGYSGGSHGGGAAAASSGLSVSGIVTTVDGINDAATDSSVMDDMSSSGATGVDRDADGHDGGEDRMVRVDAVQLGLCLFTQAAREVVAYCQAHVEESEGAYGLRGGSAREDLFFSPRALQELRVCCQKLLRVLVSVRREMRRSGMSTLEQTVTEMYSGLRDVLAALQLLVSQV